MQVYFNPNLNILITFSYLLSYFYNDKKSNTSDYTLIIVFCSILIKLFEIGFLVPSMLCTGLDKEN